MSDREEALAALYEWWLAGNDQTLCFMAKPLMDVIHRHSWVQGGTRKMFTNWDNGPVEMLDTFRPFVVHRLTDRGCRDLLDWIRARTLREKGLTP